VREYARSIELYRRASAVMAGGVNSNFRALNRPVPLFIERGEGAYLWDVDGNKYIDYVLGLGPVILGHAPKPVIDAVAASLTLGQCYSAQHKLEIELAEALVAAVPSAEMVRFSSSGSEAVHIALRLARAVTGRQKIVKFEGHYHGWLDSVMVSTKPALNAAGPDSAPVAVLESAGQATSVADDLLIARWNDLDQLEQIMTAHGDSVAGVIMEPMMCNQGGVLPQPGYMAGVRALCDRFGALFLLDEVITGFRVGLGGAQTRFGIDPDVTILAKAVAAGFTLSAIAGRKRYLAQLHNAGIVHAGTYNGNVASVAASLAAIRALAADGGAVYPRMEALGQKLMSGLRQLANRHGHAFLAQGVGQVFNTHFTPLAEIRDYRDAARSDQLKMEDFVEAMQNVGVRLTGRGTFFLSAAHTEADIEATLRAADLAFASLNRAAA
jgi:glutamate-1-semialdehyde 2,1-aminomutase